MKLTKLNLALMLCICTFLACANVRSFAETRAEKASAAQVVRMIAESRAAGDFENSARLIFTFLCEKRPRSEYLHFLGKITLPLSIRSGPMSFR